MSDEPKTHTYVVTYYVDGLPYGAVLEGTSEADIHARYDDTYPNLRVDGKLIGTAEW